MQGVHIPRTRWQHIGSAHDTVVPAAGTGTAMGGAVGNAVSGIPVVGQVLGPAAQVAGMLYDMYVEKRKKEMEKLRQEHRRKMEEKEESDSNEVFEMREAAARAGADNESSMQDYAQTHMPVRGFGWGGGEPRKSGLWGSDLSSLSERGTNSKSSPYTTSHGNVAGNPAGWGQTMWNVGKRVVPLGLSLFRPTLGNWLNTGASLMSGNMLGAALSGSAALGSTLHGNLWQKGAINSWGDWKNLFQKHVDFDPSTNQGRWNIIGKAGMLLPVLSSWMSDRKYTYPTMNQSGYFY